MRLSGLVFAGLTGLAGRALAHGDHGGRSQKPVVDANASWMEKHMAGNLRISN